MSPTIPRTGETAPDDPEDRWAGIALRTLQEPSTRPAPRMAVQPSPIGATGPATDRWADIAIREAQRSDLELGQAIADAPTQNPQIEARILRVQARTGLPPDAIRGNLEGWEQDLSTGVDPAEIRRRAPKTAQALMEHPGLIVHDVARLSGLEWLAGSGIAALQYGVAQTEYGGRAFAELNKLPGLAGESNRARIQNLESDVLARHLGDESWLQSAWVESLKTVPQILGAVGFGAAGAFVAGQAGPQAGLLEEFITVPGGAIAGAAAWTFLQEAGFAYQDISKAKDIHGRPLDPSLVHIGAWGSGAANTVLELFSLGKFARVTGMDRVLNSIGGQAMARAMKRPGFRQAVARFTKDLAVAEVTEGGTEFLQALTPILAEVVARRVQGGDWEPENWQENWAQAFDDATKAFQAMTLLGPVGGAPRLFVDVRDARRTARDTVRLDAMAQRVRGIKLLDNSPEAFVKFVKSVKETPGVVQNVYVPLPDWNATLTKAGLDPRDAAGEILGDGGRQYAEAQSAGGEGHLVIPLELYLWRIAPDEGLHGALLKSTTFGQAALSQAELAAKREAIQTLGEEIAANPVNVEDLEPAERTIYEQEYAKALGAHGDAVQADTFAMFHARALVTLAKRAGLDPLDFYNRYDVTITGPADVIREQAEEKARAAVRKEVGKTGNKVRPDDPRFEMNSLARWIARHGGIADTEEGVWRDNYRKLLAPKEGGHSFDELAEMIAQEWPEHFKDRSEAFDFLRDEWAFGERTEARGTDVSALSSEVERVALDAREAGATPDVGRIARALIEGQGWQEIGAEDVKLGDVLLVRETGEIHTVKRKGGALVLADGQDLPLNDFTFYGVVPVGKGTKLGQRAFHGTPKAPFSRFSTKFVGTGEGEHTPRTHGWGIYLTSEKAVAEWYKRQLSRPTFRLEIGGEEVEIDRENEGENVALHWIWSAARLNLDSPGQLDPIQKARDNLIEVMEQRIHVEKLTELQIKSDLNMMAYRSGLAQIDRWIEAGAQFNVDRAGAVLAADIPETEDFLDLEKSISEQSEQVKAALRKGGLLVGDMVHSALGGPLEVGAVEHSGRTLYFNIPYLAARDQLTYPTPESAQERGSGPEFASRYLASIGIPGATYIGRSSGVRNYVIYDDSRIGETLRLGQSRRGEIEFFPGGQVAIRLFERSDPSTLFHEASHFYFKALEDLVYGANPAEGLIADYEAILGFMGVRSREQVTEEHHEKFAGAFEQYLRENRAPSEALRTVFQRIRAWMMAVYGQAKALVTLTPEIRDVFDRMLASEDEILRAELEQHVGPLADLAAKMTPAEQAAYLQAVDRARDEGAGEVRAGLLEDLRERTEYVKNLRGQVRAGVEKDFESSPLMRAIHFLRRGRMPGIGETPKSLYYQGKPLRLSRYIVAERWGEDVLREFPAQVVSRSKERGADPDDIAPLLGFGSGDALVQALRGAPSWGRAVAEETQRRLNERFEGSTSNQPALAGVARDAVTGQKRIDQLLIEVNALRQQVKPQIKGNRPAPFDHASMARMAYETIEQKPLTEVQPWVYQRQAQSHGTKAFQALDAGKIDEAYRQKQAQLWNMMLYRAARDARKQGDAALVLVRRLSAPAAQARIGRSGGGHLEQMNGLLEHYALRSEGRKAIAKRQSLRDWLAEQLNEYEDAIVDPGLAERAKMHFKEMKVSEFRELIAAVKNIAHLATTKNTLLVRKQKRDFADWKTWALASIREHIPDRVKRYDPDRPSTQRGVIPKLAKTAAQLHAWALRREEVVDRMDGRRVDGPWSVGLWNPLADAQHAKSEMLREVAQPLIEAFEKLRDDAGIDLFQQVNIASLGQDVTRFECMIVALNSGSDSNGRRMSENGPAGEAFTAWSHEAYEEMLATLTRAEWGHVQKIWDTLEIMWPRIAALEKRRTGVEPPHVEPVPFRRHFEDGTFMDLPGGYYPLVYSILTMAGQKQEAASNAKTQVLFDHGYSRAMTPHGWVNKRVDEFGGKILLSLDVLPRHILQVVHDLTHREAILQANKILTDPEIMTEMVDRLGIEQWQAFNYWLRWIANSNVQAPQSPVEKFLRRGRMNATVVAIGLKASVGLQNVVNFANVLEKVSFRNLVPSMLSMLRRPLELTEFIHSKSTEMKFRFEHLEREIHENMADTGGILAMNGVQRVERQVRLFGYAVIAYTDMLSARPAWLAAYHDAVGRGETDETAVLHADRVVRTTLGSGAPKDLANIQATHSEPMKAYTMFYSWFSNAYARFSALHFDARSGRYEGRKIFGLPATLPFLLARMWCFWFVPAVLGEIAAGRGPKEDDEDWPSWLAWKLATYPAATVPLLRDAANFIYGKVEGQPRNIHYGPVGQAMEEVVNAGYTLAVEGSNFLFSPEDFDDEKAAKAAIRGLGYARGLPSGQAEITFGYLYDVMTGEEQPDDGLEFAHKLLYRRPRQAAR